jgi:hypothetical protein
MTSMYVKFDFLSMIVVEEYVPLLPNILSQIVFVDEQSIIGDSIQEVVIKVKPQYK